MDPIYWAIACKDINNYDDVKAGIAEMRKKIHNFIDNEIDIATGEYLKQIFKKID